METHLELIVKPNTLITIGLALAIHALEINRACKKACLPVEVNPAYLHGHMELPRQDLASSQKKEALDRITPDTSQQIDLEVRVLAELLLDIHEFRKRKAGDFRNPNLDARRWSPNI